MKEALSKGDLGCTKGRLLVDVADESTEEEWLKFGLENPRHKVEDEVKRAKHEEKDAKARQPSFLSEVKRKTPAAVVPVRVNLEMTPTQFARYEKAWEQIRQQGHASTEKMEALLEIMESFWENSFQIISPREKNSPLIKR